MVSLPMIKLEIPVDRDDEFIDIGNGGDSNRPNRHNITNNNSDSTDDAVPDLIRSLQRTSRPSSETRSSGDEGGANTVDRAISDREHESSFTDNEVKP